jgi:hypothetical protein
MLGHKIMTYRHGALYFIRTETRHTVNRWTYKGDCVIVMQEDTIQDEMNHACEN